ncbi:MAG: hypothetical protein ACK575_10795 [Cyanobacteriota bacterium]
MISLNLKYILAVSSIAAVFTFFHGFQPKHPAKMSHSAYSSCVTQASASSSSSDESLQLKGGTLKLVGGQFLVYERMGRRVETSVAQPDFGQTTDLRLSANGEIYAIGRQRTYRVSLALDKDGPRLLSHPLPVLYRQPCGFLSRLLGTCQEESAIYSPAVSAVFASGYDSHGRFVSHVYGLTKDVLDLSQHPTPHYQSDCEQGLARLVGPSGASSINRSGVLLPLSR